MSAFSLNRVPVAVMSYEMCRRFAQEINDVPYLELMVCDEGHRLKNSGGYVRHVEMLIILIMLIMLIMFFMLMSVDIIYAVAISLCLCVYVSVMVILSYPILSSKVCIGEPIPVWSSSIVSYNIQYHYNTSIIPP